MIPLLRNVTAIGAGITLYSCTVGPDYHRPDLEVPGHYKRNTKNEAARPKLGRNWWRVFGDSDLNHLEEAAISANQDVKAAMARVTQARAVSESVRSGFFPVIGLDASASRTRIGNESAITSRGTTTNKFSIPFDLSYEIDLWGRVRRSYESAKALAEASAADYEVVLQTAEADVAQNYFNLRSFDAQVSILHRNVELYRKEVELTESQFKAGLVTRADVLQAESLLNSTLTQETEAKRQRDDLEHALAILTGRPPSNLNIAPRDYSPTLPFIPAGLPAELLQRRPDVWEAEQNLVSASAQIGVATAAFFPTITLTSTAGFESTNIAQLLNWENRLLSIGTTIAQPVFQGGKLRANLKQAKARYDELLATYRGSILGAFRDVENSLVDLHRRASEADTQAKAVAADRESLALITRQYRSGLTTYLQVINAERTLLTNELSEKQIQFNQMVSSVLLIKALGGGWKE